MRSGARLVIVLDLPTIFRRRSVRRSGHAAPGAVELAADAVGQNQLGTRHRTSTPFTARVSSSSGTPSIAVSSAFERSRSAAGTSSVPRIAGSGPRPGRGVRRSPRGSRGEAATHGTGTTDLAGGQRPARARSASAPSRRCTASTLGVDAGPRRRRRSRSADDEQVHAARSCSVSSRCRCTESRATRRPRRLGDRVSDHADACRRRRWRAAPAVRRRQQPTRERQREADQVPVQQLHRRPAREPPHAGHGVEPRADARSSSPAGAAVASRAAARHHAGRGAAGRRARCRPAHRQEPTSAATTAAASSAVEERATHPRSASATAHDGASVRYARASTGAERRPSTAPRAAVSDRGDDPDQQAQRPSPGHDRSRPSPAQRTPSGTAPGRAASAGPQQHGTSCADLDAPASAAQRHHRLHRRRFRRGDQQRRRDRRHCSTHAVRRAGRLTGQRTRWTRPSSQTGSSDS